MAARYSALSVGCSKNRLLTQESSEIHATPTIMESTRAARARFRIGAGSRCKGGVFNVSTVTSLFLSWLASLVSWDTANGHLTRSKVRRVSFQVSKS